MSITTRNQLVFWGLAILVFLGLVWIFNTILLPFVLGIAVAYLLNPTVCRMTGWGLPRSVASALMLLAFLLIFSLLVLLAAPLLYRETMDLIEQVPQLLRSLWTILDPYTGWIQERLGIYSPAEFGSTVQEQMVSALEVSKDVLGRVVSGGEKILGFFTWLVLTLIVSFFMMKDWPAISDWIHNILPRRHLKTAMTLWKDIDYKLAGFIRGQLTVAFVLGLFYAIALSVAGLKYGFLIGVASGVLSIIPLLGSTLGLLASVVVAWFQSGEWFYVGIIAAIYLFGQFMEGNIITPRILGKSVGLHPLWILFALLAGGSLFGIVGMLLAVPVAAVVSVLTTFSLTLYRHSSFYTGHHRDETQEGPAEIAHTKALEHKDQAQKTSEEPKTSGKRRKKSATGDSGQHTDQ